MSPDRLQYVSVTEYPAGSGRYTLVVQCDGGGAAEDLSRAMTTEELAVRLRRLAERLELRPWRPVQRVQL